MAPIRKGDGTTIAPTDYQQIRKGDGTVLFDAIPDSVVYQANIQDQANSFSDGDTINTLVDQIGSQDLSAVGAPIYRSNGINGNPAAEIDGVDDAWNTNSWGLAINQPHAIISVIDVTVRDTRQFLVSAEDNGSTAALVRAEREDQNVNIFGGNDLNGGTGSQDGNPMILTGVFDGVNSEIRINGSTETTGDAGNRDIPTGETFAVGEHRTGDFETEAYLGEVLIADSPTTSDIDQIEQTLSNRWGIAL